MLAEPPKKTENVRTDTLNVADLLQKNPFDGVEQDQHIQIDAMLDQEFTIKEIVDFENQKGTGVYVLIDLDGEERYICTHAISLTTKLSSLQKYIEEGKKISAHIGKRSSQKDASRKVYYLY